MSASGIVGRLAGSLRDAWRQRGLDTFSLSLRSQQGDNKAYGLFRRALALGRSGDLDMAARLYSDAAALEPTFSEAIESQAEALDMRGQRALAVQLYERARKVRSNVRLGAPDRHFVLRQRGHFVAEILAYDSVVRSLSENTLPYVARGNAYLAAGQPERALADYERARKLTPISPDISILRGESLSLLRRYKEALEEFDGALAMRPSDVEALSGRAIVRMALGRLDDANTDWRQQLQFSSQQASIGACIAMRLAAYDLALPALTSALVKEPLDSYWHLYRLAALRRLGLTVSIDTENLPFNEAWPSPLLALHAGRIGEREVLEFADTDCRRVEALFQLGVLKVAEDRESAVRHWREVVERALPSMIEYAAARNELSRLGS